MCKENPVPLKIMILGHGGVGKTCMLITYTTGKFPDEYIPTVFDNYEHPCYHNSQPVHLGLWDTAGGEDYPRLRPLSYPQTDVFTLLFDVTRPNEFDDIKTYWTPEIEHHCPGVPIVLVASKIDLRTDDNVVTTEQGLEMSENIGAVKYMEISSLKGEGLAELFEEITRIGFDYYSTLLKNKKRRKCIII